MFAKLRKIRPKVTQCDHSMQTNESALSSIPNAAQLHLEVFLCSENFLAWSNGEFGAMRPVMLAHYGG